jgi:hypothetical protein
LWQQELAERLFNFLKKPGKEGVKGKASPSAGQKRKSTSKSPQSSKKPVCIASKDPPLN